MRPKNTLIMTAMCFAQLASAQQQLQPQVHSALHSNESDLASLCFLFQGLPQNSSEWFHYSADLSESDEGLRYERYLSALLETPRPEERILRDVGLFVASRVYVDEHGKPKLFLAWYDASLARTKLDSFSVKELSKNGKLLKRALATYLDLVIHHGNQEPPSTWDWDSKMIATNVCRLSKRMVLVNRVDPNWHHPYPVS